MSEHSLFKVTKEQLWGALNKVIPLEKQKENIRTKLQIEEVRIKIWFGLRKKVVTKRQHILMQGGWSYYLHAAVLGYISWEDEELCEYLNDVPSSDKIESWLKAAEVYLSSDDFEELYTLLFKEPGE